MTRWVMVADLERCVGCQTCTAACKHANATSPFVQWRRVLDIEAGSYPNVSRTFVPVGCQHCEDPPCMHVCPSTATRRRADGIVTIDYDICIGCAYCDVACPYQARFKIDAPVFAYDQAAMQNEIVREDPHRIGVAQKCTFCSDRVDFGLDNGMTPGVDPLATPACVNACIADALHFGDIDDPNSNVSRLLREQKHFRMHEEIGTEPGFYYVYEKGNGGEPTSSAAHQRSSLAPAAGKISDQRRRALASAALGLEGGWQLHVRGHRDRAVYVCSGCDCSWPAAAAACSARHLARGHWLISCPTQDRPSIALRIRAAPAAALMDGAGGMAGPHLLSACRARVLVRFGVPCSSRPPLRVCCSCFRKR